MLRTILAFFGYVKVPKEAVEMSILLENDFRSITNIFWAQGEIKPKFKDLAQHLEVRKKAIQTLTQFLRSGRLLT